jgi:hypothetical protein
MDSVATTHVSKTILCDDPIIHLNVRGKHIETKKSTLFKSAYFRDIFLNVNVSHEPLFIDCKPKVFAEVLEFLKFESEYKIPIKYMYAFNYFMLNDDWVIAHYDEYDSKVIKKWFDLEKILNHVDSTSSKTMIKEICQLLAQICKCMPKNVIPNRFTFDIDKYKNNHYTKIVEAINCEIPIGHVVNHLVEIIKNTLKLHPHYFIYDCFTIIDVIIFLSKKSILDKNDLLQIRIFLEELKKSCDWDQIKYKECNEVLLRLKGDKDDD